MNIKVDSRLVKKGDTFIALRGISSDGHDYIEKAIELGASKIVAEEGNYSVDTLIVPDTRKYLTEYLETNFSYLFEKMKVIGITGTNGKTTSACLLHNVLNNLGKKTAYIGTLGYYVSEKIKPLNNTTPDIMDLFTLYIDAYERNCEYIVMEVSSQGLSYDRVEAIKFDYAIFTNLTQDHLDFHGTMENYALAKQKLFKKLKKTGKAIVNIDDSYKDYYLLSSNKNITYGFDKGDYSITDFDMNGIESNFNYIHSGNNIHIKTPLIGKYNLYNLLVVISVLTEEGVSTEDIVKECGIIKSPDGRMEKIIYNENAIIIDYAHTPDAIMKILNTVKEVTKGSIYTVFGATGDRDRTKRPKMMKIVSESSKYSIITNDDPHHEDPDQIVDDLISENKSNNYEVILDRGKAIEKGISLLDKNDALLILGKGHETHMIIGDKKVPFNDKEKVLEVLKEV